MKLNEIKKTDPDKKFNYRDIYGVTIHKSVMHADWISRNARNPKKKQNNLHHTTSDQGAAYKKLENDDYDLINGWEATGKEFPRETDNKDGVWFERSIAIFAKPGQKGAVAVLPSGKLKTVTSKTWKPELSDFKS